MKDMKRVLIIIGIAILCIMAGGPAIAERPLQR
jgi:hypothetical protein